MLLIGRAGLKAARSLTRARGLRVWRCCPVKGWPLLRWRRQLQLLAGDTLDRHFVNGHLVDSREKPSRSVAAWRPVFVHQCLEKHLLIFRLADDPHRPEGDYAAVGHRAIAFEAAVVEDLTGRIDLEADTCLMLDVCVQMPARDGVMGIKPSLSYDIEQRDAVGTAVRKNPVATVDELAPRTSDGRHGEAAADCSSSPPHRSLKSRMTSAVRPKAPFRGQRARLENRPAHSRCGSDRPAPASIRNGRRWRAITARQRARPALPSSARPLPRLDNAGT
jgi:hypothetical protein